jgi:hypothetical protein
MIIAELIEQLSKLDLTLTVYVETDTDVSPVHTVDRDQFHEGDALRAEDLTLVEAVVLVATEESEYGPRGPRTPEVRPAGGAGDGHDHGEAGS